MQVQFYIYLEFNLFSPFGTSTAIILDGALPYSNLVDGNSLLACLPASTSGSSSTLPHVAVQSSPKAPILFKKKAPNCFYPPSHHMIWPNLYIPACSQHSNLFAVPGTEEALCFSFRACIPPPRLPRRIFHPTSPCMAHSFTSFRFLLQSHLTTT